VRLRVSQRDAVEDARGGQFIIERLGSTANALTVSYLIGGSAVNGADYQSIPSSVTIPAGAVSVPVDIVPIRDTRWEGTQSVTLTLSSNNGYTASVSRAENAGTVLLYNNRASVVTIDSTVSSTSELEVILVCLQYRAPAIRCSR